MNKKCYAIIANGSFLPKTLLEEAIQNKILIALDGAVDKLLKMDIIPHYILGDFDSLKSENLETWGIKETFQALDEKAPSYSGKLGTTIIPRKNQNLTDLAKAIEYCDSQACQSIDILCATGERMDHTLYNLRILKRYYKKERPIKIHTEKETISYLHDETVAIKGEPGDICGIFAYPSAQFSSKGLKYNGEEHPLSFAMSESACNELAEKVATIEIQGDALLIAPGELRAHQKLKSLSHLEISNLALKEQLL